MNNQDYKIVTIKLEAPHQLRDDTYVDWSDESISLSQKFYQQVMINHRLLQSLEYLVKADASYLRDGLRKFRSVVYNKPQHFDRLIKEKLPSLTPTYVLVLLYRGQYYGHTYVWMSSVNPKLCLIIEPVGRVDEVFLEEYPIHPDDGQEHLIKACVEFAKEHGCDCLTIIHPQTHIKEIMEDMGAKQCLIGTEELLGSVYFPHRETSPWDLEFDHTRTLLTLNF